MVHVVELPVSVLHKQSHDPIARRQDHWLPHFRRVEGGG
jgi:hypothetical protein